MNRLLHDFRQTKRAAVLVSVDLKGAYDRVSSEKLVQFLNSQGLSPEWIPYLSQVILKKHLKVVSQNSQDSAWLHVYEGLPQGLSSSSSCSLSCTWMNI